MINNMNSTYIIVNTYQNGVSIIIAINAIIIIIVPIVSGYLIDFKNGKYSSSDDSNVPTNNKMAPIRKIAGAKYGNDM